MAEPEPGLPKPKACKKPDKQLDLPASPPSTMRFERRNPPMPLQERVWWYPPS